MTATHSTPRSFLEAVQLHLASIPDRRLLTYLANGEDEADSRTFRELDLEARKFAALLQARGARPGDRVLLALPGELPFVSAFLGCLYAGLIAVPAHPPRIHKGRPDTNLNRIRSIMRDCQPKLALLERETGARVTGLMDEFPELKLAEQIAIEDCAQIDPDLFRLATTAPDQPAFLQYTSGSTAEPKGVILTYDNIFANLSGLKKVMAQTIDDRKLMWLPFFHDMGLIGNLLLTLFNGCECIALAPLSVLQKPVRWLQAIARYQATTSGGPNFGYELCLTGVSDEERSGLDLSSWRLAYNGAEPVQAATLRNFERVFAPCGLRKNIFAPCYGLAEATVLVSAAHAYEGCRIVEFDREALNANRAQLAPGGDATLVSCGLPRGDTEVRIVDPERGVALPENHVGEIWICGRSVSPGYWNNPEENRNVFGAHLRDEDQAFLRSGDLGFLHGGELYVTGRLKDLILINGRNIYPQDLELSAKQAHVLTRTGAGAAFCPSEADQANTITIVQEVHRHFRPEQGPELVEAIRLALAAEHDLNPARVALVKFGAVPRTTSGKVRRRSCAEKLAGGELPIVFDDDRSLANAPTALSSAAGNVSRPLHDVAAIRNRILAEIAAVQHCDATSLPTDRPFSFLGLTSVVAVQLAGKLEAWLGRSIPAATVFDYNTIDALAEFLAGADAAAGEQTKQNSRRKSRDLPDQSGANDPIAIVGIGCRFPGGANDPESFWKLLREGRDCVSSAPLERWLARDENRPWQGGFLDDIAAFDSALFGISPREAERMDPQQRMLLETTFAALEDAGFDPFAAAKQTGVYIGISSSEYALRQLSRTSLVDGRTHTGGALAMAANRISYVFGFQGPSLSVDTACSSSLVALHLACEELQKNPQTDLCIAGGANLLLTAEVMTGFAELGVLSPNGRCRPFDAAADGIVRGEGVGVVCLQRLSDAVRLGVPVYAVIRGGAVNQDGRSFGLTAPNGLAQQAMLREACERAQVSPATIGYVEAHGTGTALGDPVEASALGQVYGAGRSPEAACAIGSVKSNLGHLEAAAGVASVIKAALMLHHKRLAPSLHFSRPNPEIDFTSLGLRVQTADEIFPADAGPRRIGVSAFGFGGTNAHVILEEYDDSPDKPGAHDSSAALPGASLAIPLAANSAGALRQRALTLAARAENIGTDSSDATFYDLACASATRQKIDLPRRLVVRAAGPEDLSRKLRAFAAGETERPEFFTGVARARQKIVFVFAGQGPKFWPLAAAHADDAPEFTLELQRCSDAFRAIADVDLLQELQQKDSPILAQARYMQPALFAIQMALVAAWRAKGVEPDAVLGHSMGEVAAACVAGCLDLSDALRILFHRGRLVEQTIGRMAMIALPEDQVRRRLGSESAVSIAAVLAPSAVIVAGETAAVDRLLDSYEATQVFARPLESVGFASHSRQMDPVIGPLLENLVGLAGAAPQIPFYSTVYGKRIAHDHALDAQYWAENLRQPVLFYPALQAALADGHACFVEFSPHSNLIPAIRETLATVQSGGVAISAMVRDRNPGETLTEGLAELYVAGAWRNFSRLYARAGRKLRLPPYPFERTRHWLTMLDQMPAHSTDSRQSEATQTEAESPVSRFYDSVAAASPDGAGYLTFGPFDRVYDGFSWMMAFAFPERYPEQFARLRASQLALRAELFDQVDFNKARRALDFGCGHGTDLIQLASKHPQLRCDGFTLSSRQRLRGIEQSRRLEVEDRVRIFQSDSARDPFPGMYDVAFGFEVAGHIEDKDALFSNLNAHLENGGYCLLADFVSRSLSAVQIDSTASYSSTAEDWARVLARHQFRVTRYRDISEPIANFLDDPNFDENLAELAGAMNLTPTVRDYLFSYRNLGAALRRGFLSYVLLTARKDALAHESELLAENLRRLAADGETDAEAFTAAPTDTPAEPCYRVHWAAQPLSGRVVAAPDKRFQVICNEPELAQAIRAAAERSGITLSVDAAFSTNDRAAAADDIVYIAPTIAPEARPGAADLSQLCADFLALYRSAAPRLWCVTHACAGPASDDVMHSRQSEAINPETNAGAQTPHAPLAALLWGLGRTLREEEPGRLGALLDLDPDASPAERADALIAELSCAADPQQAAREIAYRFGLRYAPRLLRSEAFPESPAPQLRADAAYLVTGAGGELGRLVIERLIQLGAKHIVCLNRTASDAAFAELARSSGASFEIFACDVADADALARLMAQRADAGLPPIRGVVHAAGIHEDAPLSALSQESLERVLAPKALGTLNLHQIFADTLDFFIGFSSASSTLARPGQASYAAANAFLDAFAQYRRRLDLPATSIGWGPWRDIGFARSAGGVRLIAHLERLGITPLSPEDGLRIFERALDYPGLPEHLIAIDVDWMKFRTYHPAAEAIPLLARLLQTTPNVRGATVRATRKLAREFRAGSPAARRQLLEDFLRGHTARVLRLGKAEVDPERPMNQMGLDSLMAIELKNLIEGEFQIPAPVGRMFRGASIRDMAAQLSGDADPARDEPGVNATPGRTGETTGAPLLPVQHWFFEQQNPAPDHWNVSGLITFPGDADVALLEATTAEMMERHESLRVRFPIAERGPQTQQILPTVPVPFSVFDLSEPAGPERARAIARAVAAQNAGLKLAEGPVFRVAFFKGAAREQGRLFLTLHHLIADGFGVTLFFREFLGIYEALRTGRKPAPRPPGPSLTEYARALKERANSAELRASAEVWEAVQPRRAEPLPEDFANGLVHEGGRRSEELLIDATRTARLMTLAQKMGAGPDLILLAALVQAFTEWSGKSELAVSCEHHGRDGGALDASRLLAWCSSMYPLALRRAGDIRQTLHDVKARLDAVPADRSGYGLLRYLADDADLRARMAAAAQPQVKLLYHGNLFEHIRSAIQPHAVAPEPRGPIYDPSNRPRHLIYVYGALFDECLRIEIAYMQTLFKKDTIRAVLENMGRALEELAGDQV